MLISNHVFVLHSNKAKSLLDLVTPQACITQTHIGARVSVSEYGALEQLFIKLQHSLKLIKSDRQITDFRRLQKIKSEFTCTVSS